MLNKRRQTNLGLFRRYIEYYLKNNTHINSEMTLMVRQLTPTEKGVLLEVYCFTHTKEWEQYEIIIADIFDHLFAIVKEFELVVFEEPTGNDLRRLKG
jgi:miniconductance mechanosensitive channel